MLAMLCAAFLVLGLAVHLFLLIHTRPEIPVAPAEALKLEAGGQQLCPSASDPSSASSATSRPGQFLAGSGTGLLWVYTALWQRGWPTVLAASVLLVPLHAVVFDLALALCTFLQMPVIAYHACLASRSVSASPGSSHAASHAATQPAAAGAQQQDQRPPMEQQPLLGCMAPAKCFKMRCVVTAVLQSVPSIGFSTWALTSLPNMHSSGKHINVPVFMLSLATSMLHTLVAISVAKELLVLHGSVGEAVRALFDLGQARGPAVAQAAAGPGASPPDVEMQGVPSRPQRACAGQGGAAAGVPLAAGLPQA
jgi:hypothetical protein